MTKVNKKTESTELTVMNEDERNAILAELAELTPAERTEYDSIPRLTILGDTILDESDPDKPVIVAVAGSFTVKANGKVYYAKEVKFRPIMSKQKITRYKDTKDFKLVSRSIYFDNYNEEICDSTGGIACGRIFGKAAKALYPTTEKLEAYKKEMRGVCPVHRHVFGVATFGKDEILVDFRVSSSKAAVMGAALEEAAKRNKSIVNSTLRLKTVADKQGDNTYYNLDVTIEAGQPLDDAFIAHIGTVNKQVKEENAKVREGFLAARRKTSSAVDADTLDEIDAIVEEVDEELNDDPWEETK